MIVSNYVSAVDDLKEIQRGTVGRYILAVFEKNKNSAIKLAKTVSDLLDGGDQFDEVSGRHQFDVHKFKRLHQLFIKKLVHTS